MPAKKKRHRFCMHCVPFTQNATIKKKHSQTTRWTITCSQLILVCVFDSGGKILLSFMLNYCNQELRFQGWLNLYITAHSLLAQYHNTPLLSLKNLHRHCFRFRHVPGEIANNDYAKFWGVKEVYYGICASREYGKHIRIIFTSSYSIFHPKGKSL